MFIDQQKYIGRRLPPRTKAQGHGKCAAPFRNPRKLRPHFDSRHVTRADLPFATIGVFHVHPNITRDAAREDFPNQESCPSSPSTNATRVQVMRISPPMRTGSFNMSTILTKVSSTTSRNIRRHGTRHRKCPLRTDWVTKYMKTGSGYDRTFPDCMIPFVFGWGKTDIQQGFRKSEIGNWTEAQLTSMQDDFEKVIADY